MHYCMKPLGLSILVALAGLVPAQEEEEKAVRESIAGFFAAIRNKDLKGAAEFWSSEAPEYESFGDSVRKIIDGQNKDLPASVEVPRCVIFEKETAFTWVRFKGKWGDEKRNSDEKVTTWHVVLRRFNGKWKWWAQEYAVLDLARALVGAKEGPERAGLFEHNKEVVNVRLFRTLCDTATELSISGKTDAALTWLDVADEALGRLNNPPSLKIEALLARGQVLVTGQRSREAIAPLRDAKERADKTEETDRQAEVRMFLGGALVDLGRTDEGMAELTRSMQLAREINHLVTLTMDELFMGSAFRRTGKFAEAQQVLDKGRVRAKGIAGGLLETLLLSEIGQLRMDQGDFGGSLKVLLEALGMAKQFKLVQLQGRVLMALGLLHQCGGELDKSLEYLSAGLEIWDGLDSDRMRAKLLSAMSGTRTLAGDFAGAAEEMELALKYLKKSGDLVAATEAAANHGILLLLRGDADAALRRLREGLEICPKDSEALLRFPLVLGLGAAYLEQRQWDKALEQFDSALSGADKLGTGLRMWADAGRGRALAGRAGPGDLEAAVRAFRQGLARVEKARQDLGEQTIQQSFLSQHVQVQFFLAEALLRLNRPEESFAVSEQAKARTLIDLLDRPGSRLVKGMTEDERREEEALQARSSQIFKLLEAARLTDEQDRLGEQLHQARRAVEEYQRKVYLRHPELKTRRGQFEPATLAEIQRALFASTPGLGIATYLVGNDEVILFVLKGGKDSAALTVHRLPLKFIELQNAVADFWVQCSSARGDYQKRSRELYDALVRPAERDLEDVTHLLIVPDRMLHFLPFQALQDGQGRHLVERWSTSFAPSVTALMKLAELADRRKGDAGEGLTPLLAVGAPVMPENFGDLENAGPEVETLAAHFKVKAVTGAEATETRVKELLPKARRIHIATHGKVNGQMPLQSFVVLGRDDRNDGMLSAAELADLDLRAEMIVLSACETGLGQWRGGEGVVGLTWAAASAGVPTSLLSQWQVDDRSTRELMSSFYQGLEGKQSKADALRAAQLQLMKDKARAHPYFWSPFVLMGDWRR
jgi:CHAT domain-containing protein